METELSVRAARSADPTILLELAAALRRTLSARGEHLPATWPEEAVTDLRAGRLLGCLVSAGTHERALGLLSPHERRAFGQVHVEGTARPVELARRALDALLHELPGTVDRVDFGVTGLDQTDESVLAPQFTSAPGRSAIRRFGLRRPIDLRELPADPVLPEGVQFVPVRQVPVVELARVDVAAFEGGPDAAFLADTPAGDEELLGGIVAGQLGRLLEEASPALVDAEGLLLGFALTVEESPRSALLADVAVRPQDKGRGFGRALLHRTIRGLAALGHAELRLWVTEANQSAHQLYVSAGFRPESTAYVYRWTRSPPSPQ